MVKFGGNEFDSALSVPLAFGDRFFVLEQPSDSPHPLISVVRQGRAALGSEVAVVVLEVLKNEPGTALGDTKITKAGGIVAVSDAGRFVYKVRPGSDTSVVFGTITSGEVEARITDRMLSVGGVTVTMSTFTGAMAGVVVHEDGSVGVGAPIPAPVQQFLTAGEA
jgi:hypothetical protein